MNQIYPMVAKTFQGLEDVLSEELIALGAQNVEAGLRMVTFEGDLEMMYKANLCCRTALRILKPISKFTASNSDELYDMVRDFEWDQFLTPDKTFAIDSTVNSSEFTHSRFVTYRVKDGIADYFNDKYGRRPSIRLNGADINLNVHIAEDRVTISLDSSGESLNKRGYRVAQTEAPINEVLAAGIILKTGWRGESDFVDPMCGSGTFLIEAALIAANINPGIFRQHYAFETWPDFNKELFEELYNDDSQEREFAHKIYGGDISQAAIAAARKNIKAAGVESMVELECKPFDTWQNPPADGILITNPPYDVRINPTDIGGLYESIGDTLKQQFKGYHAWILGYKDEHFREIGLKASVKFPILNGSLECELREYVLFDGKYNEFKTAGGSVQNKTFNRDAKPKVRRMTDEEWERETRKFGNDRRPSDRRRDDKKGGRDFKKPFGKDDRKPFRKDDRRPFDRDRRNDDREEKREWKKDTRSVHQSRKDIEITNKGPKLPAESTTVITKALMRSRKSWYNKNKPAEENNED
ncbi:MAG: RNA methyltransferase [Muribaculaceae bacterium]|nr:RNA methyltransferase [Muribaculaceae bacterium]